MPDKIRAQSLDLAQLNYQRLLHFVAANFPSCICERQPCQAEAVQSSKSAAKSKRGGGNRSERNLAIDWRALGEMLGESLHMDPASSLRGHDVESQSEPPAERPVSWSFEREREGFGLMWPGKKAAVREAMAPTNLTLRPVPEKSLNWDTTHNLYIEGDNLSVLKLLQGSYLGRVKMIYIDPPYNTGNDSFVYNDRFAQSAKDYERSMGQEVQGAVAVAGSLALGDSLVVNPSFAPRYHSAWCSMMYSRLLVARSLLRRDGLIFVSIDDHEMHHMRDLCDEVFGANNFVACFPRVTKRSGKSTDAVASNHDYVLLYGKSEEAQLVRELQDTSDFKFVDEYVSERGRYKLNQPLDYDSLGYTASLDYPLELEDQVFVPGGDEEAYALRQSGHHAARDWAWRWSKTKVEYGLKHGFIVLKNKRLYTKTYEWASLEKSSGGKDPYTVVYNKRLRTPTSLDYTDNVFSNDNAKKGLKALFDGNSVFEYSKPLSLLQSLVRLATDPQNHDIVLDFFSGSATTADAVMRLNAEDGGDRRFILVQLPEICAPKSAAAKAGFKTICDIGKERIRKVAELLVASENSHICTKMVHGGGGVEVFTSTTKVNKPFMKGENASSFPEIEPPFASKQCKNEGVLEDAAEMSSSYFGDQIGTSQAKSHLDVGFRVFRVDSSNFSEGHRAAANISQDLLSSLEGNIKPERSAVDLLFACVLDWHLPLDCPFAIRKIAGFTVYDYNQGDLLACFAQDVGPELLYALADLPEEKQPLRVVLRDSCFENSASKINLSELFASLLPQVELRVL